MNLLIIAKQKLTLDLIEQLNEHHLDFENVQAVILDAKNTEEDNFEIEEENTLYYKHKEISVTDFTNIALDTIDYVLWAGSSSEFNWVKDLIANSCLIIDLNGSFAKIRDIPVVVPSVNDESLIDIRNQNIVSLADPCVSALALTLAPMLEETIEHIFVSSMISQNYFGSEQVVEFASQNAQLLNGLGIDDEDRLAFDIKPYDFKTKQGDLQKAIYLESAKVMPSLVDKILFHTITVPVFYGLSQKVTVQSSNTLDPEYISLRWQETDAISFAKNDTISTAQNINDEDNLLAISDLRTSNEQQLSFWVTADEQKYLTAFLGVKLLGLVVSGAY